MKSKLLLSFGLFAILGMAPTAEASIDETMRVDRVENVAKSLSECREEFSRLPESERHDYMKSLSRSGNIEGLMGCFSFLTCEETMDGCEPFLILEAREKPTIYSGFIKKSAEGIFKFPEVEIEDDQVSRVLAAIGEESFNKLECLFLDMNAVHPRYSEDVINIFRNMCLPNLDFLKLTLGTRTFGESSPLNKVSSLLLSGCKFDSLKGLELDANIDSDELNDILNHFSGVEFLICRINGVKFNLRVKQ